MLTAAIFSSDSRLDATQQLAFCHLLAFATAAVDNRQGLLQADMPQSTNVVSRSSESAFPAALPGQPQPPLKQCHSIMLDSSEGKILYLECFLLGQLSLSCLCPNAQTPVWGACQ